MNEVLQWGVDVILAIQKFRTPFLDSLFTLITSLGDGLFYFLILPYLFWCIDSRISAKLIIIFCLSFWVNAEFKNLLDQPRPFNIDLSVKIGDAGGPGLPSGHAQGSLVLWGYLALWMNKGYFYALSIIIICLIALSRIYLGLHFPTDILGGWALGLLILFIYSGIHKRVEAWFTGLDLRYQILIASLLPLVLSLIAPTKWSVSPIATLAGFGVGYSIERRYIKFSAVGKLLLKLLRYIIGISILSIMHYELEKIFPHKDSSLYLIFIYLRFWLVGLMMSAGVPWIFKKLNLTKIQ